MMIKNRNSTWSSLSSLKRKNRELKGNKVSLRQKAQRWMIQRPFLTKNQEKEKMSHLKRKSLKLLRKIKRRFNENKFDQSQQITYLFINEISFKEINSNAS